MRFLLVLMWLLALPPSAQAGPWPRDHGTWFIASTIGRERGAAGWQHYGELYAEHGVRDRLTLATQLRNTAAGWRGDLVARWHPLATGPPLGLSAGLRLLPSGAEPAHLLLAAHLGRGFDTRFGNLWTRLDLLTQSRPTRLSRPVELSLSGQVGLRHASGWLGIMTVTGKRRGSFTTLELSPQIGREVGRHAVVLGLSTESSAPHDRHLQLSLWSRF